MGEREGFDLDDEAVLHNDVGTEALGDFHVSPLDGDGNLALNLEPFLLEFCGKDGFVDVFFQAWPEFSMDGERGVQGHGGEGVFIEWRVHKKETRRKQLFTSKRTRRHKDTGTLRYCAVQVFPPVSWWHGGFCSTTKK